MIARISEHVQEKKGTVVKPLHIVDDVWRVTVECKRGHVWTPRVNNLLYNKTWCPECHGNVRHTIEMLHAHAEKMGGACLSTTYINSASNHKWQCGACSHIWEATWNNVNAYSSWCPSCCNSIREHVTREVFREHFPGHEFLTDRAAINMELDGFSTELKLAFEHDGLQHRQRVGHFQRSDAAFEAQQARDRQKDAKCAEVGITLVRVPDRLMLPNSKMRTHIHQALADLGHPTPALSSNAEFLDRVRMNRQSRQKGHVEQVTKILAERGELMITAQCPTMAFPIIVRCAQGHEYETSLDNLIRGRGCTECNIARPKRDSELEAKLGELGCRFISSVNRASATNSRRRKHVTLECLAHHETVETLWDNIRVGKTGCPKCVFVRRGNRRRLTSGMVAAELKAMRLVANEPYRNNSTPTVYTCNDGHQFTSTFAKLRRIQTDIKCPSCTIAAMPDLDCKDEFTPETVSNSTKLRWVCKARGHTFDAAYGTIQRSRGRSPVVCKECRAEQKAAAKSAA